VDAAIRGVFAGMFAMLDGGADGQAVAPMALAGLRRAPDEETRCCCRCLEAPTLARPRT
jgi:hypothetical protein